MAESGAPQEIKKYQVYALNVDKNQDDKATEIKLCNFARPHMRAFHCSWWAFFIAFFIWFSIAPLLREIKNDLGLSKEQIWTSNIVSVMGTIFMRFALGPACDKYGARVLFTIILCACSIPAALTGIIQDAKDLIILRLFIGLVGSCFVMCQFWSSRMFTKEVVGTANALVGGWGNLGGGVTQLVMGSALFPLFKMGMSSTMAWRTVCIVPAAVGFVTGVAVYFISDDAPKGNYSEMKKNGTMPQVSAAASFRSGAMNINTWILFIQYGCSFGVELTMNNAAAMYFGEIFDLSTESSAAIASIFGWMNLFARGLGGYMSDKLNAKMGMRGRLITQFLLLAVEGVLIFVFSRSKSLPGSIVTMVFFSIMVQGAEGSTYGIVPYVNPASTGSIAGIVGAGGNTGAVCFGLAFRQLPSYLQAFDIMGGIVLASSLLSGVIFIKGHTHMFGGQETISQKMAGAGEIEIPMADAEGAAEVNA
mmetsp:Transcript_56850/g.68051  ORF Transcript_56850/g.68051 Transcript_56850/m.68051 type:complete len:477 (+) Transcript_56850:50-1480(+)